MSKALIVYFEAAGTLAVVVSSNEPPLLLAEDLTIIAAGASVSAHGQLMPPLSLHQPLTLRRWPRRPFTYPCIFPLNGLFNRPRNSPRFSIGSNTASDPSGSRIS